MLGILRLIGIIMIALGISCVIDVKIMKRLMRFCGEGRRLYAVGVIRLVMGVILLMAAPGTISPGVISTLGILVIIGGITIFILGVEKTKAVLSWWQRRYPLVLRLGASGALIFGILILYSI